MTPSRLLLAWSIIRLRHPLIASRVVMTKPLPSSSSSSASIPKPTPAQLDEHYRSAAFVLDPPNSPAEALTASVKSLTLALDPKTPEGRKRRSEDLMWEYNNGPRSLSADEMVALRIYRAETPVSSSSNSNSNGRVEEGEEEKREQYILFLPTIHAAMDGIATFSMGDEFFALVGGASAISPSSSSSSSSSSPNTQHVPRSESQLHALLRAEWALRYGAGSPLRHPQAPNANTNASANGTPPSTRGYGFIPASLEARVAPFEDQKLAMDDFEMDQAKFQVRCFY